MEDKYLGGVLLSLKMGRPTDNPKTDKITVRLDNESSQTLKSYCEKHQVGKGEAIRRALKKLKSELK